MLSGCSKAAQLGIISTPALQDFSSLFLLSFRSPFRLICILTEVSNLFRVYIASETFSSPLVSDFHCSLLLYKLLIKGELFILTFKGWQGLFIGLP